MGNNSVPKFIFRLSRFPVYRGYVLGRFYCISFVTSVRPHDTTGLPLDGFSWHSIFWTFFEKICRGNSSFIQTRWEWQVLYTKPYVFLWQYLARSFLKWELFQTKVVETIKTHILWSITFFRKSCRLWGNVTKYDRSGRATDGNTAHSLCMLDN